jgi:ribosomal protein L40E
MEQRVYHGTIDLHELAQALLDEWDRDETVAQALEAEGGVIVQIGQRSGGWFGGDEPRQALTLGIEPLEDGVRVTMGQQQWYKQGGQIFVGGLIGFFPFFFAWPLGGLFRGEDPPLDRGLPAQIWQTVERYTQQHGAATGPTRRLATVTCPACGVANPKDATTCSACGEALSAADCPRCGAANPPGANFCLRCGAQLRSDSLAVGEPGSAT